MSLKVWRAALAAAVEAGLGITVYPWNAPHVDPPCAVIDPGDPYLNLADEDAGSFTMHTVRWSMWLVLAHVHDEESLDALDDLIDSLVETIHAMRPAADAVPEVETVDAPTLLQIGGTDYLVARCTISTLRST